MNWIFCCDCSSELPMGSAHLAHLGLPALIPHKKSVGSGLAIAKFVTFGHWRRWSRRRRQKRVRKKENTKELRVFVVVLRQLAFCPGSRERRRAFRSKFRSGASPEIGLSGRGSRSKDCGLILLVKGLTNMGTTTRRSDYETESK